MLTQGRSASAARASLVFPARRARMQRADTRAHTCIPTCTRAHARSRRAHPAPSAHASYGMSHLLTFATPYVRDARARLHAVRTQCAYSTARNVRTVPRAVPRIRYHNAILYTLRDTHPSRIPPASLARCSRNTYSRRGPAAAALLPIGIVRPARLCAPTRARRWPTH
jgi:hypothetical protein